MKNKLNRKRSVLNKSSVFNRSVNTYGRIQQRLLNEIPCTNWLPSDDSADSRKCKDIFDSSNSLDGSKCFDVKVTQANKLFDSDEDQENFQVPKKKKVTKKKDKAVKRKSPAEKRKEEVTKPRKVGRPAKENKAPPSDADSNRKKQKSIDLVKDELAKKSKVVCSNENGHVEPKSEAEIQKEDKKVDHQVTEVTSSTENNDKISTQDIFEDFVPENVGNMSQNLSYVTNFIAQETTTEQAIDPFEVSTADIRESPISCINTQIGDLKTNNALDPNAGVLAEVSINSKLNVTFNNSILHHAANIEMDGALNLIQFTHANSSFKPNKAIAQSTPFGGLRRRVCTRSFLNMQPILQNSLKSPDPKKIDNQPDSNKRRKNLKQTQHKSEGKQVGSKQFVEASVQPQSKIATKKATKKTSKPAKKKPRKKTVKKVPAWKKCPGSAMKARSSVKKKNNSILQQIMFDGKVDGSMTCFDDVDDVYFVNSIVSSDSELLIKLPGAAEVEKGDKNPKKNSLTHKTDPKSDNVTKTRRKVHNTENNKNEQKSVLESPPRVEISKTNDSLLNSDMKKIDENDNLTRNELGDYLFSDESENAPHKFVATRKTRNLRPEGRRGRRRGRKSVIFGPSVTNDNLISGTFASLLSKENERSCCERNEDSIYKDFKQNLQQGPNIQEKRTLRPKLRKRRAVDYKLFSTSGILSEKSITDCSLFEADQKRKKWGNSGISDLEFSTNNFETISQDKSLKPIDQSVLSIDAKPITADILDHVTGRKRQPRKTAPVPKPDQSSLFSTLSFNSVKQDNSLAKPMHAFSIIHKTIEEEEHGDLLSDDESVKTQACVAKRISTPIACATPSLPAQQLYDLSPPHGSDVIENHNSPESSKGTFPQYDKVTFPVTNKENSPICNVMKSPPGHETSMDLFSPIAHTTPEIIAPSSIDSHRESHSKPHPKAPALHPCNVLNPRIMKLRHERTTSTPNSDKISSTKLSHSSPSFNKRRDERLGSYTPANSSRRRARSPGSHLSSSIIQIDSEMSSSVTGSRRRTLNPELRSQILDVVKKDLSSVITKEFESVNETKFLRPEIPDYQLKTPKLGDRFSLPLPQLRVLITPLSDSFIQTSSSCERLNLKSLGFVNALTPARARAQNGHILTAREKVLFECGQTEPISFNEALSNAVADTCVKLGEGLYGEVFRCSYEDKQGTIAIKIIPIEGSLIVNNEKQKTFEEVMPEIVSSKELHTLRNATSDATEGFIELHKITCTRGKYPDFLIDAWDKYDNVKTSENDRPDNFSDDQLYLIFQFADGGTDVEHFQFKTACQAYSVLQQVCAALAVAEKSLQFEHRDLHWGNILVTETPSKNVSVTLGGKTYQMSSHGVKASIIDFTLSRLSKSGVTVFQDLSADPELFTLGSDQDYQFEIYRMMQRETKNYWATFKPRTNIFWLHYLNDKFCKEVKYKNKKSKLHKSHVSKVVMLNDTILNFDSCLQIFQNCHLIEASSF